MTHTTPDGPRKGPVKFQLIEEELKRREKAVVIVPLINRTGGPSTSSRPVIVARSDDSRLQEAVGLAEAIDLDIVYAALVKLKGAKPATLFGSGKVTELGGMVAALEAGLVIVDHSLTPVQQHNLEKAWNAKVLDRTGLILEIFGERARTKEGRLQVELAHLNYQKGRLVRSWTHLERQRGALGFVGGPGETQIESDRRQLQERINRLEADLEKVRKTRELHRSRRQKIPHPVVALVGYTNAGKSTLFNLLTNANVKAEDQLFATLDPTLRQIELPEGTMAILSDTVGFISELPTHLIAAFRATLEEVVEADLILHVRDIAQQDSAAQARDVEDILSDIGVEPGGNNTILEVWNKIDLLDKDKGNEEDSNIFAESSDKNGPVKVSALTGEGISLLLAEIERRLTHESTRVSITLAPEKMGALPWIYENTHVIERQDCEDGSVEIILRVLPRFKPKLVSLTS